MITINALLQRGLKKIWASKSGGVLIYVAFGLPILLGAMALSIDLGRAFILNTELKDFSDASALAGAAELDGRDGAMDAAEAAARTGITGTLLNVQGFATDGGGHNIVVDPGPDGVVFLKQLPADGTDFVADDTATSDADARFIFVKVVNRDVRSGLSRSLGVTAPFETSAKSIAGFITVICRTPAMFMCNPLEGDGSQTDNQGNPVAPFPLAGTPCAGQEATYLFVGAPVVADCLVGRGMLLKNGGGGGGGGNHSAYYPGEFGLLGCPEGIFSQGNSQNENQGIKCVAESIAQAIPDICIAGLAFPQTGQGAGPIRQAINVRFGVYENPQFGNGGPGTAPKDDPLYRPALNVTKGYEVGPSPSGSNCHNEVDGDDEAAMAAANVAHLPRDDCFYDATPCDRYGDGDWHTDGRDMIYWNANHPGILPPTAIDPDNASGEPYADMTRYELYRFEIDSMWFGADSLPGVPRPAGVTSSDPIPAGNEAVENGLACQYTPGNSEDPQWPNFSDPRILGGGDEGLIDRRILTLAAVNCVEHGPFQGAQPDGVPIEAFVQVFLTEPTRQGGPDGLRIYGEIAGVVDADDGLKDIVQLYR